MKTITSSLVALSMLSLNLLDASLGFTLQPSFKPTSVFETSARDVKNTGGAAPEFFSHTRSDLLQLSLSENSPEKDGSGLPMLLDPGTRGGAVFLSLVLFIIPFIVYNVATLGFGVDETEAGRDIGVGFTVITCLAWASTYIFRVATKDMTYAKQLKDYENAVIAKRLEELDEDEVQALVEDIERDDF